MCIYHLVEAFLYVINPARARAYPVISDVSTPRHTKNLDRSNDAPKEQTTRGNQQNILLLSPLLHYWKDLFTLKTPARVRTNPPAAPIRNTAATFNPNATPAFDSMIKGPILDNSRNGAKPSVKGMKHALIIAHT